MRNERQPPGESGLTFGKTEPTDVFDVKMSQMTFEVRSDAGLVTVWGYPEGVWRDAAGALGLHLDDCGYETWLEIPFNRVISWQPDDPDEVLFYEWRYYAHGGGAEELRHFFASELKCLDRVSRGLDAWPRHF